MDRGQRPSSNECPSRSTWKAFSLGRIPPEEQEILAEHLVRCPTCQQLVAAANETESDDTLLRLLRKRTDSFKLSPADQFPDTRRTAASESRSTRFSAQSPGVGRCAPLPEGTRLGHFVIRKWLGEGGFGIVYLATDERLKRDVALKLPRQPWQLEPNSSARLIWEAQAAARLDHPNLLPVHEAGEADNITYIASTYCPGPSLGDWLKQQKALPTIDDTVRLVICLADAVGHAHARGVLHRDIKPDNVLLEPTRDGGLFERAADGGYIPRLTDFGLAKCIEADPKLAEELKSRTGITVGTPPSMAPEQTLGRQGMVDVRTDIYALGALMYRILTGRPPISGGSNLDTLRRHRTGSAGLSEKDPTGDSARCPDDLHEVPGEITGPPVRHRTRTGRRPPPIPGRRHHSRPPRRTR